jgi:hypothetical protein
MGAIRGSARTNLVERAGIFARIVLATGGSYAVAALATALLSVTLPLERSEAVTTATLLSFAILAGVVVLVFALHSVPRAAGILFGAILVMGSGLWLAAGSGLFVGGAP